MEIILLISTIIGIVCGIIAILEKFYKILPNKSKKRFKNEFDAWMDSNHALIPKIDTFYRFLGYAMKNNLKDEENAFVLIVANHYGDKSLHPFIKRNFNNQYVVPILFDHLVGRGIRVGWRAEYILSKLDRRMINQFCKNLPKDVLKEKDIKESIKRINDNTVEAFLVDMQKSNNQKIKAYSYEVLNQIHAKNITI